MNEVLVVCGPTAAGKSSFAVALARELNSQIVNADSTQVYRYMDVGTDKVSVDVRAQVEHHMLDLVDPDQDYTAADYCRDARAVIADLLDQGVVPIVCGGTGFYIRALLDGLFPQPPIDPEIRAALDAQDLQTLYARLENEDPRAAAGIEPNDRFRVVRALEVLDSTGEPISTHWQRHRETIANQTGPSSPREAVSATEHPAPYTVLKVGITRDRDVLYDAINERATHQIHDGLLEAEVRGLLERYPPTLPAFKALTYRHMIELLAGRWTPQQALETLQRDTRHYAKRQMTWLRRDNEIEWFTLPGDHDAARNCALDFAR